MKWAMVSALVAAAVAAGVTLALTRTHGARSSAASHRAAQACTAIDHGSDVEVHIVATDAKRACANWVRVRSGGGAYWSVGHLQATYARNGWTRVCTMRAPQGGYALVYDDGGQASGKAICGDLVAAGWSQE